jgi:hypothetical protein
MIVCDPAPVSLDTTVYTVHRRYLSLTPILSQRPFCSDLPRIFQRRLNIWSPVIYPCQSFLRVEKGRKEAYSIFSVSSQEVNGESSIFIARLTNRTL